MKKSSKKSGKKNKKYSKTKRRNREEDEEDEEEISEGCDWMVIQRTCAFPLGEAENLPSTCNPRCPARTHNNHIAAQRNIENRSMFQ